MSNEHRLLDAFHHYNVPTTEYLEKAKVLNGKTGPEREKLQNELAEWIETSFPKKERKPPRRKFSETEMNAVDVVFNDSINTALTMASGSYEALEYVKKACLFRTNLDVGYINEPEDSDYRKTVSWRLATAYTDETDEELLEWSNKYPGWEYLCSAMEKEESLRIWYSENPKELCGFYYLCSLLTTYPVDVFAVHVPDRKQYGKDGTYRPVYTTGQLDSDDVGEIVESAVKLSAEEIKMYADEWNRLKQENAPLRTVIAGRIVSVYESFYDSIIWKYIPTEPMTEARICGDALYAMQYIHHGWLTLRIQKMIDNGMIIIAEDNETKSKRLLCRKKSPENLNFYNSYSEV